MVESDRRENTCMSCYGTGETVTNTGPADCPDCGGSGILPTRAVLIEWRARDVERAHGAGDDESAVHVRWLVAELRSARSALNEIIALAHDAGEDGDRIAQRIRFVANRALGTYEISKESDPATKVGRAS